MKTIKYFFWGLLTLWLFGAGIMMIVYEIERKHDCVDKEGLFKGLLWCETDVISSSAIANRQLIFFLNGLRWPFQLFSDDTNQANEEYSKNRALSLEEI